jgi:hypothetical protein
MCDTGTQRRLVADAQRAERLLATDRPALLAAGIDQRQQRRHYRGAGMALGVVDIDSWFTS